MYLVNTKVEKQKSVQPKIPAVHLLFELSVDPDHFAFHPHDVSIFIKKLHHWID